LKELISILIPTYKNRHDYLRRSIAYHAPAGIPIYIVDSSNEALPEKEYRHFKNVHYLHVPSMAFTAKIRYALEQIKTPYTLFIPDDDFNTPQGINQCVEFLEIHPDYATVQGHIVRFHLNKDLSVYPLQPHLVGYELNNEDPAERVRRIFEHHNPLPYCVHRTENIKSVYDFISSFSDDFIIGMLEYYIDVFAIMKGKHKVLPVFFCAREYSATSSIDIYLPPAALRANEKYNAQYNQCLKKLAEELAAISHFDLQQAEEVIDYAFHHSPYFSSKPVSQSSSEKRIYPLKSYPFLKRFADKVPGSSTVKTAYSKMWSWKYRREKEKGRMNLTRTVVKKGLPGYPFTDMNAKKEWEKIKQCVLRYPVIQ
jgi:glycosyltransferase domain-containing protein